LSLVRIVLYWQSLFSLFSKEFIGIIFAAHRIERTGGEMSIDINEHASKSQPGMSGKVGNKRWINLKEQIEQKDFIDQKLHDAITAALKIYPEHDISKVSIQVSNQNIILKGLVTGKKAKRAIEATVRIIPGVKEVLNILEVTNN
jgi:osmotically-inducible protein OsmY